MEAPAAGWAGGREPTGAGVAGARSPASTVHPQGWEQGSWTRSRTTPPSASPPTAATDAWTGSFEDLSTGSSLGLCSHLGRGEICGHDGLQGQGRKGFHGKGWGAELPCPGKPVQSGVRAWTSLDSAG